MVTEELNIFLPFTLRRFKLCQFLQLQEMGDSVTGPQMTPQLLFKATRVCNEPFLFLFLTCSCNPSFLQGPIPRRVSAATQQ